MTEEQIFEEFGLEPEPSSARAIVTRLQQAELEMEPSQNAEGKHEMTLRLLEEEPDEEDHVGSGAPTTPEATELPPPPNRKGGWYPDPEGSGRLRFWNKTRWTDSFKDAPSGTKPRGSGAVKATGSDAPSETPQRRGRWGGAPWWAWVLAAFVAIVIISAIASGNKSSNDSGSNVTVTKAAQTNGGNNAAATQAAPTATTASAASGTSFGDGTWQYGNDFQAGTYRAAGGSACYWAELKDTNTSHIIDNNVSPGPQIVELSASTPYFQTEGCGDWTPSSGPSTGPSNTIADGTWQYGTDFKAGTYRAPGGNSCYWAELKDANTSHIIDNNVSPGPQIVELSAGTPYFMTEGCGTWTKSG